ncbi:sigma-54 interaction domain-containing protein [Allosphingosinicella vermicomposti]|uniref:sigma-54 interaction domain-containing protein n=1 Tax=Allosphingosinicella vermicomposti TaxID=614671 RepID=UPI001FE0422C|nr:sigma 54-interacting transcriptional regulator [Allosphingosinicella vermicomposti]
MGEATETSGAGTDFGGGLMIGLSEKVVMAHPLLQRWLMGAGVACLPISGSPATADLPTIFDVSEADAARSGDLLIEYTDGAPALILGDGARPALLRFGFDDMAFGHALVAELMRSPVRPACGEPESARLLALAERVSGSGASVLILGETGTGKEGLARFIHASSARASGPFVAVNCAALPETMIEAILFGHRKGSFTGASADSEGLFRAAEGGTLLLDEISELPLSLQAKLLRALQEREVLPVGAVRPEAVDVRVIACANRDLAAAVAEGKFRADLYWRLNVMPLQLLPLSHRRLDVRAIAAALILRHMAPGEALPWPTATALDRLMAHNWPGNARELDNVLQRAMLLREGDRIEAADLQIETAPVRAVPRFVAAGRAAQEDVIRAALASTGGHRLKAAEQLGISERTLRYRLADMRVAAA